jgi:hypothetical protein
MLQRRTGDQGAVTVMHMCCAGHVPHPQGLRFGTPRVSAIPVAQIRLSE